MLRPTSLPGAASRAPAYRKDIATPKSSLKHFLARDTLPRDAERKGRIFDATPNQLQYRTARNIHVYAQVAAAGNEEGGSKSQGFVANRLASLKTLVTPFSDPAVNARLVSLCVASALCSVATLIHDTYLPIYLSEQLGLSNTKIGNLQAVAQFLCNFSKSVSGTMADILSPARMVIFGTLLTTLNKPMFALSGWVFASFGTVATLYWITAGKVFDRMSKGIREAPGKALIGDLAAESGDRTEGAFGLRQACSTFGALLGATVAGLAFQISAQNYTITFALSTIPALAALILTISAFGDRAGAKAAAKAATKSPQTGLKDTEIPGVKLKDGVKIPVDGSPASLSAQGGQAAKEEIKLTLPQKAQALAKALPPAYWQSLLVVGLLYFARFDASFITLRAKQIMPKSQLPALTSTMMVAQAFLAAPAGLRAKTSIKARNSVLLLGYAAMIAADLSFAFFNTVPGMFVGAIFVGIHMATTHGVTLAMMSSYIPTTQVPGIGKISGTAWSLTDFIFGIILAYSNSLAGSLSDASVARGHGNIGCFIGGIVATILSGVVLLLFSRFSDLGREDKIVTLKKSRA